MRSCTHHGLESTSDGGLCGPKVNIIQNTINLALIIKERVTKAYKLLSSEPLGCG